MSKNENLQELLNEAFHTYQLYLKCVGVDIGGISHLSLLKWPDAVQSALNYAETISKNQKDWFNGDAYNEKEVDVSKSVIRGDLCVLITKPIETIYESTIEHITKHIGKKPNIAPLSYGESWKFPIQYKNRLILAINDLFKTLETMTGTKYPQLSERTK